MEHLDLIILFCGIPGVLYGFFKSPLWPWVASPVIRHRRIEQEWRNRVERLEVWVDNMDTRMENFEVAIAPTNGDRRSISDRLDSVKYQTRVVNTNITALAQWLADQHPEASKPPVIIPLPER